MSHSIQTHKRSRLAIFGFLALGVLLIGNPNPLAVQKNAQTGWRVEIEEGKTTRSSLTINNRCKALHQFRVENKIKYLRFEQPTQAIPIGAASTAQLGVMFDATGLKLGMHRDKVIVKCLDCKKEKGCAQDRDELPVEVTVRKPIPSNNAEVPVDGRVKAAEQDFRTTISAQVANAANRVGVALLPGEIAYVAGDGGFVINTALQSTNQLDPRSLATGTDLLFVYVGAPDRAVPEGYYKVRLTGRQAQFIDANGKVAGTFEANVEQGSAPAPAANLPKKKVVVKVTGSWGKNGPEVDIEITFGASIAGHSPTISAVTIPIPTMVNR